MRLLLLLLAAAALRACAELPPPALLLPCEGRDTCQQDHVARGPRPLEADWRERNCLCDRACAEYGDCCQDAAVKSETPARTFACSELRNFGGIYMVSTCAPSWVDEATRRRCEAGDPSDPLSSELPLTHKGSAVTYRNLNCALCNLPPADVASLAGDEWEVWGARLECPTVLTGSRDLASVRHALRFENGSWGLRLPRNMSAPVPQPPQPANETDISDKLQAFMQATNETRSRLLRGRTLEEPSEPVPTSSGLRHLSRRNYALYNASQFHRNDSALAGLLRQRQRAARARRDLEDEEEFHRCDVDPLLPDTLTHLVRRCRPKVVGGCPVAWVDPKVRGMCEAHTAHVFGGATTYRNVYCAMCWGVRVQELACHPTQLNTRLNFNKDFNVVAFAVLFDFGRGKGSVGSAPCPPRQLFDPFLGVCRSLVCGGEAAVLGRCVAHIPPPRVPCSEPRLLQGTEFSVAQNVLLEAATGSQVREFRVLENGSALICPPSQLNLTLTADSGDKFGAMLGYITLVGLGISIICLSLHLLAFCLVPDRTTHGGTSSGNSNSAKNLASLCSALLIAYCGFLGGQLVRDDREFCVSAAVVTFYSFLAAFTWMFAVSLDIWRSLRLATTQLRTSHVGRTWRKFLVSSACCWLAPALVVLAAVIVENAPPGSVVEELRPGFGLRPGICWFSSRKALLVFFAAPISAVMLLNAVFFTSSALMIYSTTASTAGGPRRDFRLYLRLAVLMGLTWSVGLLAGFLDTPLLWVVFVVLNSLQGLFIFLAFTCTQKMVRALKEGWLCCYCHHWRRKRRRELVTSSSLGVGGIRKLGVPSSSDHLPWSAFSSSVASSKSTHSEDSASRATDETLY